VIPQSYRACETIVRRSRSNFAIAFRLLGRPQRQSMNALYAFMRLTDDLSDEPGENHFKRENLTKWRSSLDAALQGHFSHPIHAALHHTVKQFGVAPKHLHDVIDGVATDLEPVSYETFDQLYPYCYQVASAVGLACLPIWGCTDERAAVPGEAAGIAFQLTNILRDLGEDATNGRVYLPQDELQRFGISPPVWQANPAAFREFMTFQVQRIKQFYEQSEPLPQYLAPGGRAIFQVMSRTYRGLLSEIEQRKYDVFSHRVRVPHWRKLSIVAQAWLTQKSLLSST
jgi:15-cis-phytoene synthase